MFIRNLAIIVSFFLLVTYIIEYINNKNNPDFTIKKFLTKNINNIIAICIAFIGYNYFDSNVSINNEDFVLMDDPF